MIDTLTGWVDGSPFWTKKGKEMVKKKKERKKENLLHVIILRFFLPGPLQIDNGTSFTSKVAQVVSK